MKPDKVQIWKEVLESVRVSVSPAIFSTWLSQTHLVSLRKIDEKRYLAEIGCPSAFIKATVEKRYFGLIQDEIIKTISLPTDLTFVVKQNPEAIISNTSALAPLFEDRDENEEYLNKISEAKIRPGFTFEKFAVSGSNQMAHAAAEAVAGKPGESYNPLFIWGGVGVGKTHLMHAVGHKLIKNNLDTKIIVCTGEDFTNDIVEGIRNKTTQRFREKYRKAKALFIDDIQFIAGKGAVQDEFFHTFNAVTGAGGQIILTSDKPPSEITYLEDRLISRFEAGLVVDISPPDFELRCAITQIKAQEKGLELEVNHVHMIAGNIDTARKIEGFLIKLMSEVKLKNLEISEELITSLFGKGADIQERKKATSPDKIIDAVCQHYSISKRAMSGKGRSRMIARPRQILMYLLRTELNLPLEEVGNMIGGRDHSTVIHAVDTVSRLASVDVQIREDILRIKNSF
jgi:chromosomal replication initiator protein